MSNVSIPVINGSSTAVLDTVLLVLWAIAVGFTVYVWYRIYKDR